MGNTLQIVYYEQEKCITFIYDGKPTWNIYDVERDSTVLDLFGRVQYALDKHYDLALIRIDKK